MNGDDYVEDSCAKFYPSAQGAVLQTSNGVDVTLMRLTTSDHVTRRVLRLTSVALAEPYDVCQLQLQSWKMYDQVQPHSLLQFQVCLAGALLKPEGPKFEAEGRERQDLSRLDFGWESPKSLNPL